MNRRTVNENSKSMCAACDIDLATCDTIWAAEGILYCSRDCGIHDFKSEYGDDAEKHFDEVSEEINPRDIGIELEVGYHKNEWCVLYSNDCGNRACAYFDLFEQAHEFTASMRNYGMNVLGMMTTRFKQHYIDGDN